MVADLAFGSDCVGHAEMFFPRPSHDRDSARAGTFVLTQTATMRPALAKDWEKMTGMIFGEPPTFDDVLNSIAKIEHELNRIR